MSASSLMCRLSEYVREDDPSFSKPFMLVIDGAKWTVATDHTVVVAVRGAGPWPLWDATAERIQRVTQLLASEPKGAVTVALSDLLAWSTGEDDGEMHGGQLLGILVDTCRVAQVLTDLPFPKVLLWDASEAAGTLCLGFGAGGRWKALVAGMHGTEKVAPFDPAAQRSTFDAAMALDD